MNNKIWLSSPHMGGAEEKYVKEAFDKNWVAPLGPNVNQFEAAISESLSTFIPYHTAALTSGTAALHLALRMLDVIAGDVVIVQSFTFCGTTNPVTYQGAEIVFIDSEPETWNMCPEALAQAMADYQGKKVKAIMPVHLYGMPAKMEQIQAISDQYQVPVIEDAAEALGSTFYQDQGSASHLHQQHVQQTQDLLLRSQQYLLFEYHPTQKRVPH